MVLNVMCYFFETRCMYVFLSYDFCFTVFVFLFCAYLVLFCSLWATINYTYIHT